MSPEPHRSEAAQSAFGFPPPNCIVTVVRHAVRNRLAYAKGRTPLRSNCARLHSVNTRERITQGQQSNMQLSIIGALVCLCLLLANRNTKDGLLVCTLASMAFGATALLSLTSLGGSSPLITALFSLLLVLRCLFLRNFVGTLEVIFRTQPSAWCVLFLIVYSVAGAYLLPRLFQNEVVVFISTRNEMGGGSVKVALLGPTGGNITQSAYLAVNAALFFAASIAFRSDPSLTTLKRGLFAWACLVATFGLIDLVGVLTGTGELLLPIKTASFALISSSDHALAGFARLSGSFSESSAFGGAVVSSLAFTLTYWRATQHTGALALASVLITLTILSTSTTAYVTAVIAALALATSSALNLTSGRIRTTDLILLGAGATGLAGIIVLYLVSPSAFDPLIRLLDVAVFNKATSDSALERGSWNRHAWIALVETFGLGIGVGSTRTSSWLVAVASQLGVLGAAMMATILLTVIRGTGQPEPRPQNRDGIAAVRGARAAVLTSLVAACLASPSPDPGPLFFITAAAISVSRSDYSDARFGIRRGKPSQLPGQRVLA
jgi:hypothetical protein